MNSDQPSSDESVVAALLAVADVLENEGGEYALIGGLAAAQHGVLRATQDVDFLISVPQMALPGLLEKLRQVGCEIDSARIIREWNSQHLTQFRYADVVVDWLQPVIPVFKAAPDQATVRNIHGHRVRVVDAAGMIILKMVGFRSEDQRDVEAMIAIGTEIDWTFVKQQLESVFNSHDARITWLKAKVASWPA